MTATTSHGIAGGQPNPNRCRIADAGREGPHERERFRKDYMSRNVKKEPLHRTKRIIDALNHLKRELPGARRIEIDVEFVDGTRTKMEVKA
jgi:hypothetical protein